MNAWIAGDLGRGHGAHVPPRDRFERHRRARPRRPARALGSRVAFAHDERAGGEIAEPLVVAARDDRDRADEIHVGKEVDQSQHVADQAGDEPDRLATAAHDPEAGRALAGRASRAEHLEEHVVREDRREAEHDQHRGDPSGSERDGPR